MNFTMNKDPHHILNVKKDASDADVRKAWIAAARKHYQGANAGDPASTARMQEINQAYEDIKTQRTRQQNGQPEMPENITMTSIFMAGLQTPEGKELQEELFELDAEVARESNRNRGRMAGTFIAGGVAIASIVAMTFGIPKLAPTIVAIASIGMLQYFGIRLVNSQGKLHNIIRDSEDKWHGIWEAGKDALFKKRPANDDPEQRAALARLRYDPRLV